MKLTDDILLKIEYSTTPRLKEGWFVSCLCLCLGLFEFCLEFNGLWLGLFGFAWVCLSLFGFAFNSPVGVGCVGVCLRLFAFV